MRNPAAPSPSYQRRYEEVVASNERFLKYQPYLSRDHMPGFLKVTGDAPEIANITPGLRGYRLTICCSENNYYELVWTNFYEYIQIQKVFSMLKYQPEEIESGQQDGSWPVLYYPPKYNNEAPEALKASLLLHAEDQCFQLSVPRSGGGGDQTSALTSPTSAGNNLITIGFDEVDL